MGFFDKVKNFMGGHGVTVQYLTIEKQEPVAPTLPIGDTVVKGKFRIDTQKDCVVLSRKAEVIMEVKHPDGRVENVLLGEDVYPDPYTSRSDDMLQFPFDLAGGNSAEDFFIISMKTDIPTALSKRQLSLTDPVRFFVKTTVDVKGSPFDPEAVCDLRVQG